MNPDSLTIEEILENIEKGRDKKLEELFGENRVFPIDDDFEEELEGELVVELDPDPNKNLEE